MSITLEVGIGEALDKLSILEIKIEHIDGDRLIDVKKEYTYIYNELKEHMIELCYFYNVLKIFNSKIWNIQDILRQNKVTDSVFKNMCEDVLYLNDARFLCKKKINAVASSKYIEQKGYAKTHLRIYLYTSINIKKILDGAIQYLSFFYDNVIIYNINDTEYIINRYNDKYFVHKNEIHDEDSLSNVFEYVYINNLDVKTNIMHKYLSKQNNDKSINYNAKETLNDILNIYNKLNIDYEVYASFNKDTYFL